MGISLVNVDHIKRIFEEVVFPAIQKRAVGAQTSAR